MASALGRLRARSIETITSIDHDYLRDVGSTSLSRIQRFAPSLPGEFTSPSLSRLRDLTRGSMDALQRGMPKLPLRFPTLPSTGPKDERNFFEQLPNELIMYIMCDLLSVVDMVMLASTCRRLRAVGEDNLLWRTKYMQTFGLHEQAQLVVDWRGLFATKVETEQNWKYGRCEVTVLSAAEPASVAAGAGAGAAAAAGALSPAVFVRLYDPYVIVLRACGLLELFDVSTRRRVAAFATGVDAVAAVDCDLGALALAGGAAVRVHSLHTGVQTHALDGHNDAVSCVRLAVAAGRLASGSLDGSVRVWALATGACVHVLHTLNFVSCIDMDEHTLVSASRADRSVKLWDLPSGTLIETLEMRRAVTRLCMHSSCLLVALANCLRMELWDLTTSTRRKTLRVMQTTHVSEALMHGRRVVAASGPTVSVYDSDAVTFINIGSEFGFGVSVTRAFGSEIEPLYALSGHAEHVQCLHFDEWRIVTASADSVRVWCFLPPESSGRTRRSSPLAPQLARARQLLGASVAHTESDWAPALHPAMGLALRERTQSIDSLADLASLPDDTDETASTFSAGLSRQASERMLPDRRALASAADGHELDQDGSPSVARLARALASFSCVRFPTVLHLWYLWIAYESGAEYATPMGRHVSNPVRKWVQSTLIWLPLFLPMTMLAGLAWSDPATAQHNTALYATLAVLLVVPWIVHSYSRPKSITRSALVAFSVLEFGLVFVVTMVLLELCPSETVMWRLHAVVSVGYSVGKGLLYTVAALDPSRHYEMQTTLFYTPLIGIAVGTALTTDGVRSMFLMVLSIVVSFLYGATGGATGDAMDSMATLFAASILGVLFPFAADVIFSLLEFAVLLVLERLVPHRALREFWTVWVADHRHGYQMTYFRLAFFFITGVASLAFIKFVRNGARFHAYRKPLIRVSFWIYIILFAGTLYDMWHAFGTTVAFAGGGAREWGNLPPAASVVATGSAVTAASAAAQSAASAIASAAVSALTPGA